MRSSRRVRVASTAVTVCLALLAAASMAVADRSPVGADNRPKFDLSRGVLVTNRPDLRVCVQPGLEKAAVASAQVRAALELISDSPEFVGGYLAGTTGQWHVESGCPQPGHLLTSGLRHVKAGGWYALGPGVEVPSPYRLFVYVVPSAEIERMFGTLPFHFASQETFCEGTNCATVSTALYLDQSALTDRSRLVSELQQALGLRPPYPPDTRNGNTKEVR